MLIFDDIKPWNEKLSLYFYDIQRSKNLININKSSLKFIEVPEEEPLKNECKHFIEVINNNILPITDGYEGLKVVKILSTASNFNIENN